MNAEQRTLRIGVVGLGFGAAVHAPAIIAQSNVQLVGIAGRNAVRAQEVASKFGGVKGCGSIDELLSLKLDAITLALPPDQVEAAVHEALKANVAILCEKPLGTDANQAAELTRLAQGRTTAVDFIFGELQTFARLKQLIDTRTYGAVKHVHVQWLTQSWAYRNKNWSWKTDAAQGGGVVSLFGSHLFFLAEWLLGRAVSVQAQSTEPLASQFAPAGARAAENCVECILKFPGNVLWTATFSNANEGPPLHRWVVVFEHAMVTLENVSTDYMSGFSLISLDNGGKNDVVKESTSSDDGRIAPFSKLLSRFANGVLMSKPVYPDFSVGARVQSIDTAVRKSTADKKEVFFE
jgi:predicted dehydrogenase